MTPKVPLREFEYSLDVSDADTEPVDSDESPDSSFVVDEAGNVDADDSGITLDQGGQIDHNVEEHDSVSTPVIETEIVTLGRDNGCLGTDSCYDSEKGETDSSSDEEYGILAVVPFDKVKEFQEQVKLAFQAAGVEGLCVLMSEEDEKFAAEAIAKGIIKFVNHDA